MTTVVKFRLDESIGHGKAAVRGEGNSRVVDVCERVEWNLRGAVRRFLILAPVSVVGHDSLRKVVARSPFKRRHTAR